MTPTRRTDAHEGLSLEASRAFFSQRRESRLVGVAFQTWRQAPRTVGVAVVRYRPPARFGFVQVVAFAVASDDWPGMGEACLGTVHERNWNVHFARGFVVRLPDQEVGIFVMALGLCSHEEVERMGAQLPSIVSELQKLGIGRRAKMILLAREAKKLKVLTSVIEELASMCSDQELQDITSPQGECAKFFAARSDEYVASWSPRELASQVLTNYRLLAKVRGSGGSGVVVVEPRESLQGQRTCVTVVGLRRDISVEDCLRVVGEAVGSYEQYHLATFTTRDGLILVRLEIGSGGGKPLSEAHQNALSRKLSELISGRRAAWAQRIESGGGFEQYARAIIPLLMREQRASGLTQVYIAQTSRELAKASFKLVSVYDANLAETRPAQRIPELLQSIPGVTIDSVVPPRTVGTQRFFVLNVTVDLGQFEDTEAVYAALKGKIGEIFPSFRDFDEGMRRLETSRLKAIEKAFPHRQDLADRVFFSMDEFARLGMREEEMIALVDTAMRAIDGYLAIPDEERRPVVVHSWLADEDGIPTAVLLALAWRPGSGIPSCVSQLQVHADVAVSQFKHGDVEVTLCRICGKDNGPLDVEAVRDTIACLSQRLQG